MTMTDMSEILSNWRRLKEATANDSELPLLPQEAPVIRAIPDPCMPFQARWLLGNCSSDVLATMRDLHPEIIAHTNGTAPGIRYLYSKVALCKLRGQL